MDGEATGIGTVITEALGYVTTIFDWTVDTVVGNPLLATFFVAGLIGLGVGLVSRLKHV